MSSLGINIETTKKSAAYRLIHAAIEHLYKSEMECAITLAAAAEGLLPDTDKPSIFAYLQKYPSFKNKDIDFNQTINWLKHKGEPDGAVIFELEAAIIIARAMSKFAAVYDEGPSQWEQFLDWAVARGHCPKIVPEES
jgi:hypothetical protein